MNYNNQYYFPANEIFAYGLAPNNGIKRAIDTNKKTKIVQLAKELKLMGISLFSATPKELAELGLIYKSNEEKVIAWYIDVNICDKESALLPYAEEGFKGKIFFNK